eukprot:m.158764 g.158764  ORF g.158764 m.158764 type:complete len:88 (+) comp13358_c0_seq6:1387-1650(+)
MDEDVWKREAGILFPERISCSPISRHRLMSTLPQPHSCTNQKSELSFFFVFVVVVITVVTIEIYQFIIIFILAIVIHVCTTSQCNNL